MPDLIRSVGEYNDHERVKAENDAAIYGVGYLYRNEDGRIERLDPDRVISYSDPTANITSEHPIYTCACGLDWVIKDDWEAQIHHNLGWPHQTAKVKSSGSNTWNIVNPDGKFHLCRGHGSMRVGSEGQVREVFYQQQKRF